MQTLPPRIPPVFQSALVDGGHNDVQICKKIDLIDLSKYQVGRELLRVSKLNLGDLPIHRPVTIAILALLLERYQLCRSTHKIYTSFLPVVFSYLRHPQHRLCIRGYIHRFEGMEGWNTGFDALVETARVHSLLAKESQSEF